LREGRSSRRQHAAGLKNSNAIGTIPSHAPASIQWTFQ